MHPSKTRLARPELPTVDGVSAYHQDVRTLYCVMCTGERLYALGTGLEMLPSLRP